MEYILTILSLIALKVETNCIRINTAPSLTKKYPIMILQARDSASKLVWT